MKNGEKRHYYQPSQIQLNDSLNTLNSNNTMISSIESILFNKQLNKNKNYSCNNILSSKDYSIPQRARKIPPHSDTFRVSPFIEEIPTFSFENDINIKYYKDKINEKSKLIEKNYNVYMEYIRKNNITTRKKNLLSPFVLYNQKINAINSNNKIANNNIYNNHNSNKNKILVNLKNSNNNFYNRNNNGKNYYNNLSKSCGEIYSNGLKNEISNPEKYYKKLDINFYRYRQELKKYDDYNYEMMLKHKKKLGGEELDINPYNHIIDNYKNGDTSLPRNIILHPKDFCGYEKINNKLK